MTRLLVLILASAAATALHAHPDLEEALARIDAQIAAAPGNAELYLTRGELYARDEDWVSAEANYLRAAELSRHVPHLDSARAALALATGQAAEARHLLDHALALDPRDAEALVLRARALASLGQRPAALADFDAALALIAVPPPDIYLERAALFTAPADAIRSLDQGLDRLGPVPSLLLRALALEEASGRIDAALVRLDRIAEHSDRRESWLKSRGDLLARAGRNTEARAAYAAALAAIDALPAWLRESPDTLQLSAELTRLSASRS